ncbi:MBL fold metallo-hydrolase [Colwellia sp. 75C3]|uniref:MBL fold metallo-hydrolase n=1 Tax=Colwellia sp. 75C3 TaxID=888425 RepID=UPI000C3266A0|nr:MBL fold metallo-hydrolase [Colwellia sp. 75C3]PKG82130.1 MBL fold metallo-hydrolase [Colwellia sp. 75C3]
MKNRLLLAILLVSLASEVVADEDKELSDDISNKVSNTFSNKTSNELIESLQNKQWLHGSEDCKSNDDPAIEVFQYDKSSYILRQNKCLSYEAPFIYVLVGEDKILVLDTGATASEQEFPLYKTVQTLNKKHAEQDNSRNREVLVIHSHSHSDHYSADSQFENQPNVTVVAPNSKGIKEYYAFKDWPEEQTTIDLGGRSVTIIPTPGHQEEAISIYDTQTKWLLTGDTLYPGVIYVKEWHDYKDSITRLVEFTRKHKVSAILGAHIEMTNRAGEYYEIGTIYQPEESGLPLMAADLLMLSSQLSQHDKSTQIVLDGLVVEPLGMLPKLISSIVGWFI